MGRWLLELWESREGIESAPFSMGSSSTPITLSPARQSRKKPCRQQRLPYYSTSLGAMYNVTIEEFLASPEASQVAGQVDLVFTSPPFPLRRKKKYGNLQDREYLNWLSALAQPLSELLSPTGSIVMEVGNAWEPGRPVMSTLPLEALMEFRKQGGLELCQQFVCHNPARLPAPAQWVNIERIRVKDSYTHVWWMSPTERPEADNRRVLKAYSAAMEKLLATEKYNAGSRPSEYEISETSFLNRNRGAIPPSALEFADDGPGAEGESISSFLQYSNTASREPYLDFCAEHGFPVHPARMASGLSEFFIKFLAPEDGLVLDPFGGSNTTGATAEKLGRRWIACEPQFEYFQGSVARFLAST